MKKAVIKIAKHEVSLVLVVKLAVIFMIWFFLVRGFEIVPTTSSMTHHLFGTEVSHAHA